MPYTTLVSTAELPHHLGDPAWVVFDCRHDLGDLHRGERAYAEAHIPGARFLHLDRDLSGLRNGKNGRHPLPDPAAFAARLAACGVDAASQVVAYDDSGGMFAARLWWMLNWLGHEAVAVLDGGWQAWAGAKLPVSATAPAPVPARFVARPLDIAVDVAFVEGHLGDRGVCLIDARNAERYRGMGETLDPVGGHIPGAQNRFFRDNLDAGGRFKPAARLREEWLALLGGRPPQQVIHQCGSGVTACHNLLAMEIAGLPGSRLYPGSWSEWCSDPHRPVATD